MICYWFMFLLGYMFYVFILYSVYYERVCFCGNCICVFYLLVFLVIFKGYLYFVFVLGFLSFFLLVFRDSFVMMKLFDNVFFRVFLVFNGGIIINFMLIRCRILKIFI